MKVAKEGCKGICKDWLPSFVRVNWWMDRKPDYWGRVGMGGQEEKFSDRENRLIIKVMAEKEKMEWKRDIVSFLLHG